MKPAVCRDCYNLGIARDEYGRDMWCGCGAINKGMPGGQEPDNEYHITLSDGTVALRADTEPQAKREGTG